MHSNLCGKGEEHSFSYYDNIWYHCFVDVIVSLIIHSQCNGGKGVNCLQHWMRVGCCRQTCCAAARRRGRKEELVTLAQGIVYVKRILLLHHHQKWLCYHRRGCRWRRLCTAEWTTPFVARLRFDHFLSLSPLFALRSLSLSLSLSLLSLAHLASRIITRGFPEFKTTCPIVHLSSWLLPPPPPPASSSVFD